MTWSLLELLIAAKNNGVVLIEGLPNSLCSHLIESIHSKIEFGKRLFCNGIVPRTPDKTDPSLCGQDESLSNNPADQIPPPAIVVSKPVIDMPGSSTSSTSLDNRDMPIIVPNPVSPMIMSPNTFAKQYSETPDINYLHLSNTELVRRNSLSLRTPPPRSLAEDILNSEDSSQNYTKVRSMLDNLKEMADRFSDFASCESLSEDYDSGGPSHSDVGFQIQGRKKKGKKHKLSPSPSKEYFVKRQNTSCSPNNSK